MTNSGVELGRLDTDTESEVIITYHRDRGVLAHLESSDSVISYYVESDVFRREYIVTPNPQVCCGRCGTSVQGDIEWYEVFDVSVFYEGTQNDLSVAVVLCPNCYTEIKSYIVECLQENSYIVISETI